VAAAVTAVLAAGCTSPDPTPPAAPTPTATPSPTAPPVDYAAWAAGRSEPVADPVYGKRGNPGVDVLHYDLRLSWSPQTKTLTGAATLRVRPTTASPMLSLDFMPYTVDEATLDGQPVAATVTGEKLTVPAALTADQPVTLTVHYHGKPRTTPMPSKRSDAAPLGLTATRDGGLWTMQEPYGAFTWYPANDHPSDEALYDIAVTVPKGWTAVASGSPATSAGTTFRYRSTDPVATYLTTLAVGKYKKTTAKGPRGIPITIWYRTRDKRLLPTLRKATRQLTWLEKRFGPYPFPTAGVVVVDSESAMETQQMVTVGGVFRPWNEQAEYLLDTTMVHEYAHQWFGNSVTLSNWNDLWLNEGWAQYAQLLYQVDQAGEPVSALDAYFRRVEPQVRKEFGPPGKPKPADFARPNVYICAAGMLRALHKALGDTTFFALARAWVQDQRNTTQDRASFIAFVNAHTDRDFTKLINSWLDAKTSPKQR
jgi:aminopeptidase N